MFILPLTAASSSAACRDKLASAVSNGRARVLQPQVSRVHLAGQCSELVAAYVSYKKLVLAQFKILTFYRSGLASFQALQSTQVNCWPVE